MKVLFDTNVLLSYLLAPGRSCTIATVIETAVEHLDLVVPAPLLDEVRQAREKSPHLNARISAAELEHLVTLLETVGEASTLSPEEIQAIGRDAKDAYLIAHGLIAGTDYLVSGDKDLLVLDRVETLQIVNPAQFLAILVETGLVDG